MVFLEKRAVKTFPKRGLLKLVATNVFLASKVGKVMSVNAVTVKAGDFIVKAL